MDTTTTYPQQVAHQVAQQVADAMVAGGWSEKAMAEKTGIPRVTLRRRLAGAAFNVSELAAVAEVLGTTVSALVGEDAA